MESATEQTHRGLSDCLGLVGRAGLAPRAEKLAGEVFRRLARVEATLHGTFVEEVHFHEVGAADALADVVGFAAAYIGLGLSPGEAVASSLPFARGSVGTAHGALPLPAPATLALLEGFALEETLLEGELITPTGAALLASVARAGRSLGRVWLGRVGQGAGTREIPGRPNLLRVILCSPVESVDEDEVVLVETNLDDMSPQLQGTVFEAVFRAGALEVWSTPVQMKKGRPGLVVSALARPEDLPGIEEAFFEESTTIGLRIRRVRRRILPRERLVVETPYGAVGIKVARLGDRVVNASPEFEEAREAAERHRVPVKRVLAAATAAIERALRPGET